jgi:hypothetical protein
LREREELLSQLSNEIDHLKQEKDVYKDRLQRALRDSLAQRQQLERSIASQSTQSIVQNIRNLGSLASAGGHDA